MQSSAFADVARDCGIDPDCFDDEYAYTDHNGAYSLDRDQATYQDDPISDYTDDLDVYSSPSPFVPRRRTVDISEFNPHNLPQSQFMPTMAQWNSGHSQAFRAPGNFQTQDPYLSTGPGQSSLTHHTYGPDARVPTLVSTQYHSHSQQSDRHFSHARDFGANPGLDRGSDPRNASRTRLRPVSELPDIYRGIFKFGVFNAVQSTCFDTVMHSDQNLVISAPTGSGKTVLFELAIIRMLSQASSHGAKCVYMAPTKALCSERSRDWSEKFDALGMKCCELTGDTVQFGKNAWGDAKNATIIVTTSEKWDSLTRNWSENNRILAQVQLFLVDEVHILNESRGSTLEVVISRMKFRGTNVRFVLVSATVPNIDDIANWIGNNNNLGGPATIFQFGEEYRPCKLTRHVYGVNRAKNQNDFMFARSLDYHLYPALVQHSANKPVLIFVSTRKGTLDTAEKLAKEYQEASEKRESLPWSRPTRIDRDFNDKRLKDLANCGIGVHHAGLNMDDRRCVEDMYLKGLLKVVVATSTLAVGVNLPAHTVVLKGVHTFQNNVSVEYSDLEVMQMLGRAGRPQFDKDGVAIIFCEKALEPKYQRLVQGKTILESSLHLNLSEHLNSEIGLGTISSVDSAKEWLYKSFLFQRIKKNPSHYALGKQATQSWEDRIGELVMQSVGDLQKTGLVDCSTKDSTALQSTEFGDIMSKFYIRLKTMGLVLALPARASMRDLLEMISASEEFAELKLRSSEKRIYNALRTHNDIRFEVKKVEKTADKILLLIQAVLGGISLNAPEYQSPDSQPHLDVFNIFRHLPRLTRAMVEVAVVKKAGPQLKHGLELLRCFIAKAWEDRPVVLRQIEQIGEKSLKVLAGNGITSIESLRKQDPLRIETLLNRRPPFGLDVLTSAHELPCYALKISNARTESNGGKSPVQVTVTIECSLLKDTTKFQSKFKKVKLRGINMTSVLTLTSDLDFIDFRRIQTKVLETPKVFEVNAHLTKPSQAIIVYLCSESVAGVTVTRSYKPQLDPREYPTMFTRPSPPVDLEIKGSVAKVQQDGIKEQDIPVRDLTTKETASRTPNENSRSAMLMTTLTNRVFVTKRLPNGNQEFVDCATLLELLNKAHRCNHPCKDKMKCRHLCCRDGVAAQKRSSSMSKDSQNRPDREMDGKKLKPDRRLDDMEALHKSTNTGGNLNLKEGQRLKVENKFKPKLPKTLPNFDIKLADIGETHRVSNFLDRNSDDELLPDPSEITKALKQTPSSDHSFSNPEMDDLIRDMPIELTNPPRRFTGKTSTTQPLLSQPLTGLVRQKRTETNQENERHVKRLKTSHPDGGQTGSLLVLATADSNNSPTTSSHGNSGGTALFRTGSPSSDQMDAMQDFTHSPASTTISLDDSMDFDTFFTSATGAVVPKSSMPDLNCSSSGQRLARNSEAQESTSHSTPGSGQPDSLQQSNYVNDELAELEAWLLSGEIEIVPELRW